MGNESNNRDSLQKDIEDIIEEFVIRLENESDDDKEKTKRFIRVLLEVLKYKRDWNKVNQVKEEVLALASKLKNQIDEVVSYIKEKESGRMELNKKG